MIAELIEILEAQIEDFRNGCEDNLGIITADAVKYTADAMLKFESFSCFDLQQRIQLSYLLIGAVQGLSYGSVQEREKLVDLLLEAVHLGVSRVDGYGFDTMKTILEANLMKASN